MLKGNKDLASEVEARWATDLTRLSTTLGQNPISLNSDTVIVASGVDGGHYGSVRRYLGDILVEDPKRLWMRPDAAAASSSSGRKLLIWSAERVKSLVAAGGTLIHQMFPFEISKHDTSDPTATIRGWVVRMEPVLSKGTLDDTQTASDASSLNINFASGDAFIGILYFSGNENDALSDTQSRFRFVVPLIPVSRLYSDDGGGTETALPHYRDYNLPDFTLEDASTATTPIHCEQDIACTSNDRFIYLWSTTGEFQPVTLWYDVLFGVAGADSENILQSARSVGWHWEKWGGFLGKPDVPLVTTTTSGGLSSANVYEFAIQYVDPYRNRWTPLSAKYTLASAAVANSWWDLGGVGYSGDAPSTTELALHFQAYRPFSTIGNRGGSMRRIDEMWGGAKSFGDRPILYANLGTYRMALASIFKNAARSDFQTYPPSTADVMPVNDTALANLPVYDTRTEPTPIPTEVLFANSFQGVTVMLEAGTRGNPSDDISVASTVSTPTCNLRWSPLYDDAPEMFTGLNQYTTKLSTLAPVQLVQVGDYNFALGDGQIIRMQVVPTTNAGLGMVVQEIQSGFHLASNRAACEAKGMLFGVFRDGVYTIEPSTGAPAPVELLNRLTKDIWVDTLSSVEVEYDPVQDAIYILNRTVKAVAILWLKTQQVTVLERTPYDHLTKGRWDNSTRVMLVTDTGRFVVPRVYPSEQTLGGMTYTGLQPSIISGGEVKTFNFTCGAVALSGGNTTVVLSGDVLKTFRREATSVTTYQVMNADSNVDFYRYGIKCYLLGSGTNHGTAFTVVSWDNANSKLTLSGDQTSILSSGSVLSVDPVPFGLLMGGLESSPSEMSGTVKRHAKTMSVVVPWVDAPPQSGVPLFEVGVIDYTDIRDNEPMGAGDAWWEFGGTALQRARRTTIPASGTTFSVDAPDDMFGYVGATGHLLFPYVRAVQTGPQIELKEVSVRGTITPSEITA